MSRNYLIDPRIYDYILACSGDEPDILAKLRQETSAHPMAQMQISADQGRLFQLLVRLMGAKKTLEVGVFTGYSSLAVALALPDDGRVVACDASEEYTSVARRYWREAGVQDKIELRLGAAADTLRELLEEGHAGSFDFAFIDADKPSYPVYYELTYQLLRSGGLMAIDNVLQNGGVADPQATEKNIIVVREFNAKVREDSRVFSTMVGIADGVTLALKL